MVTLQAWTNSVPDVEQMLTDIEQKLHQILQTQILLCKKEKIDVQIFSRIGKGMKSCNEFQMLLRTPA